MSQSLQKQKHFIELLLSTDKIQAKSLIETINREQLHVIIEIITNLLKLNVPKQTKILLKRRARLMSKLTNKRLSISTKHSLVRKHFRQIYDTLLSVKGKLLQLVR